MSQTKLSDLLGGIQAAISQAMRQVEVQHTTSLNKYFDIDKENDHIVPKTISMEVPSRKGPKSGKETLDVPLITLIPIRSLKIDELSIDFEARISGVEMKELQKSSDETSEASIGSGYTMSASSLIPEITLEMKNGKFMSSSTPAKISVKFKDSDPPEGIVRVSENILNEIK